MKKLLFVDHAFHKSTASSQFFVNILSKKFDVEILFIEPEYAFPAEAVAQARAADVIVLWQMDYLAPVFLAMGLPTVVIPMYDGSAYQSDLHWIWSRQAQFINFSFTLHHRIRMTGGKSRLVKYFKAPVSKAKTAKFDEGLDVFLWQRRPEHGINSRTIMRLLGDQIRSLHIHNAPDDPSLDLTPYAISSDEPYPVTTTKWFSSSANYHEALSRYNVFIAPRRAEGIGMAMLEAMSRGMLVLASDEPTHNEYISNWVNGILFDPENSGPIHVDNPGEIGKAAYATVTAGYETWKLQAAQIGQLITSVEKPEAQDIGDVVTFATALSKAYYSGQVVYNGFMLRNSDLISRMSGINLSNRIGPAAELLPEKPRKTSAPSTQDVSTTPWLVGGRIPILTAQVQDYVCAGQISLSGGLIWVKGHEIAFAFRIDPFAELIGTVRLRLHRPEKLDGQQTCLVSMNGWTLGIVSLDQEVTTNDFEIPSHILTGNNLLRLHTTALGSTDNVGEPVSLAIAELAFS